MRVTEFLGIWLCKRIVPTFQVLLRHLWASPLTVSFPALDQHDHHVVLLASQFPLTRPGWFPLSLPLSGYFLYVSQQNCWNKQALFLSGNQEVFCPFIISLASLRHSSCCLLLLLSAVFISTVRSTEFSSLDHESTWLTGVLCAAWDVNICRCCALVKLLSFIRTRELGGLSILHYLVLFPVFCVFFS